MPRPINSVLESRQNSATPDSKLSRESIFTWDQKRNMPVQSFSTCYFRYIEGSVSQISLIWLLIAKRRSVHASLSHDRTTQMERTKSGNSRFVVKKIQVYPGDRVPYQSNDKPRCLSRFVILQCLLSSHSPPKQNLGRLIWSNHSTRTNILRPSLVLIHQRNTKRAKHMWQNALNLVQNALRVNSPSQIGSGAHPLSWQNADLRSGNRGTRRESPRI
jgi:hypothetical protein